MKNSTIALIGALILGGLTIVAVVLLLLLGTGSVQELTTDGLVAAGGTVGAAFLAWFSRRIARDSDGDGTIDVLDDTPLGDDVTNPNHRI